MSPPDPILKAEVKDWLWRVRLTGAEAARRLEIPWGTWRMIVDKGAFPYPRLLRAAMDVMEQERQAEIAAED